MKVFDRTVVRSAARALNMAMHKAIGSDDDGLWKPIVGVSSTWNDATPYRIALGDIAQYSKPCMNNQFVYLTIRFLNS